MKNKLSVLEKITLTAAGLVCAYYFIYLILCIVGVEAAKMLPYALLPIACVCLPIVLRARLKQLFGRAFKPLHIIFTSLLCLYVVTVVAFWTFIGFSSAKSPYYYTEQYAANGDTGGNTVVLVFGAYTDGMTPSQTLKNRLDAAYELLSALPDSVCVVSGSKGASETVAECVAMHAYLTELGIAKERIIMEPNARSTSENIRLTKQLLEDLGMSDKRVIGVSTEFHLPRIGIMANRYDFPMVACSSPSPSIFNYYISMIREYLSYIKMALFDKAVF